MIGRAVGIAALTIAILGAVAAANSLRFARGVGREARGLWAAVPPPAPIVIDPRRIEALPAPVRRYLTKALGARDHGVSAVRLRHGGTFRPKLDGGWLPIQGEQYFATDPPGFVWWGRVCLAPGLWIDARDRSQHGEGRMRVALESTVTVADSSGPQLDQGALLRLLGEMTWFPSAFLDERYLRWSAIDERRALATLHVNGREVAGTFEFGEDGLPARFSADRYRDIGGGKSVLTPFSGESSDYRDVDGWLVPHQVVGIWHVDGRAIPYVRFQVQRLEYDAATPF